MDNIITSIAIVIVVFFLARFIYKLIFGPRKGVGVFLPDCFSKKRNIYFDSKVEEEAFLRKTDMEKKKIIREYLIKQGHTPEEIKEIEKKNQEIVNNLIDKISK